MPLAQIMKQGGVWWERKYKKTRKKRVAWHAQGHDTFLTRKYIENQIYNLIYLPILFFYFFFQSRIQYYPLFLCIQIQEESSKRKKSNLFFCVLGFARASSWKSVTVRGGTQHPDLTLGLQGKQQRVTFVLKQLLQTKSWFVNVSVCLAIIHSFHYILSLTHALINRRFPL